MINPWLAMWESYERAFWAAYRGGAHVKIGDRVLSSKHGMEGTVQGVGRDGRVWIEFRDGLYREDHEMNLKPAPFEPGMFYRQAPAMGVPSKSRLVYWFVEDPGEGWIRCP